MTTRADEIAQARYESLLRTAATSRLKPDERAGLHFFGDYLGHNRAEIDAHVARMADAIRRSRKVLPRARKHRVPKPTRSPVKSIVNSDL